MICSLPEYFCHKFNKQCMHLDRTEPRSRIFDQNDHCSFSDNFSLLTGFINESPAWFRDVLPTGASWNRPFPLLLETVI